ncbi:MAG TPA: CHAT domain-containing protein [Thioploca sp.]|nr:CHAT domain-containing protein [Thioploca sp.]
MSILKKPPIQTNPIVFFINVLTVFLCGLSAAQAQPLLKAKQAFQHGYYEQAIEQWQSVLATTQDTSHRLEAYQGIAAAYRHRGLYDKALPLLNTALPVARQDVTHHASVLNELTQLHLSQGKQQLEKARQTAEKALAIARDANNPPLLAKVLRQWGNLLSAEEDYEGALAAFTEALALVTPLRSREEMGELYGKILINQAQTTFVSDINNAYQYSNNKEAFRASVVATEQALQAAQNWPDAYGETFALIALSQLAQEIKTQYDKPPAQLTRLAYQALNKAREVAERIDNALAKTYAYGHMGQLYEQAKRYKAALILTRRALFWAQQIREQLLLYRWQWQLGRIFKAQGADAKAIVALRQAVKNLNFKSIREQIVATGYSAKTFREQIAPVYFELADLLLQQAVATAIPTQRDKFLREARETIEFFKQAELQDYFQSECVSRQECTPLEQGLDAQTAVLYPIVLPDRLELLLSLPNVKGLVQATVPVSEKALRKQITLFLSPLRRHPLSYERTGDDDEEEEDEDVLCVPLLKGSAQPTAPVSERAQKFLSPAQQLYRWLIQPLTAKLSAYHINTLIIVPDGMLRTMPFAALHDGQDFLIQNYALAITPGLCLGDLKKMRRRDVDNMLLSGLSDAVQGFSSLPCAQYEINTLQKQHNLYDTQRVPLLNKAFTYPNMQYKIRQARYSIVHIASHGQFRPNFQDTFLLTYDDKLSMDKLERLIRRTTLQEKQVELLTLSACETAMGNDRAALGLAGVALKAGAKSALATLWKVDDVTTPTVIIEFYRQLTNPTVSKAQALQNAQKMMLTNQKYVHFRHPYYWSAFLLIGNWL